MTTLPTQIPGEPLRAFCRRWDGTELSLFGSVLRDDFRPDSDIDVLVTFSDSARRTLFDLVQMKEELGKLLGHTVDVISRRGIEASRNPIRRADILSSARTIHVAGKPGRP